MAVNFRLAVVSTVSTAYTQPTTFDVRAVVEEVISQGNLVRQSHNQYCQDLHAIYHHYNLAIPQDVSGLADLAVAGPQPMSGEERKAWYARLIALMGFQGMDMNLVSHIEDSGEVEHTTIDVSEAIEGKYSGYTAHLDELLAQLTEPAVTYCCDLSATAVQMQGPFVCLEGLFEGRPVQINYYSKPLKK